MSIVIPTLGRGEILRNTLNAVYSATSGLNVEVILVDDTEAGNINPFGMPVHLIHSGGIGASGARNKGWHLAKSDLLLFLDDDMLIRREHIQRTLELHHTTSNKAYNFFWLYPPQLMEALPKSKFGRYILDHKLYSNEHRLGYDLSEPRKLVEENGLTSQYFSIEKRWMEKVGGYDPIPFAGVEDILLHKKLREAGIFVFISLKDVVFQDESNRLNPSSLINRYRTGAFTRRIAVEQGHPELGVNFSKTKKRIGRIFIMFEPFAKFTMRIVPYGKLYIRAVKLRLYLATYRGFYIDNHKNKSL